MKTFGAQTIGVVLSGGNVDPEQFAQIVLKAQANGAGADTVAKIAFLEDGQFFFDNEYESTGFVKSYADACR